MSQKKEKAFRAVAGAVTQHDTQIRNINTALTDLQLRVYKAERTNALLAEQRFRGSDPLIERIARLEREERRRKLCRQRVSMLVCTFAVCALFVWLSICILLMG